MTNKPQRLLTTAEVADILRIPKRRVWAWARAGLLPSIRLGRLVRFSPDAVDFAAQRPRPGERPIGVPPTPEGGGASA